MKRTVLGVVTAVLAVAVSAAAVEAQNPMTFGIAAGATFPTGDLGESGKTGFHGMVTLGAMPALVPFGVRIDGMYNSLGIDGADDASWRILGATANGVFSMPGMIVASPYIIGGVGYYNLKLDADGEDEDSASDFGINIGIGTKFNLSGFGTFAEIRYHNIFNGEGDVGNSAFIPLTFGIMF
jgi:opacity protein-like surface antigen